eukprot:CAMPEP_0203926912 /NCGR_PEP_ID=MMETSP0359-20131031/66390_1 /ASSEMBLY_ACC=CAM_ASM_000338 /TAXON_ID=268821 /ORGANISM="Scrippsiella Hangoei, Strain SHTV-5" /LENGTH=103 /DNA_ID=CAMNT_0050855587 /DNA_START=41 /DNA_END=349 /DNA_ORIENTATION=-
MLANSWLRKYALAGRENHATSMAKHCQTSMNVETGLVHAGENLTREASSRTVEGQRTPSLAQASRPRSSTSDRICTSRDVWCINARHGNDACPRSSNGELLTS